MLDALVDGLFDYAGMFPPADLTFEEALQETASFASTLHRPHLVGTDMVLTPKTLPALDADALIAAGWPQGRTFRICLVGVPFAHAARTAEGVAAFNTDRAHETIPQRIETLETTTDAATPADIAALVSPLAAVNQKLPPQTRFFLEPRWTPRQWEEHKVGMIELIGQTGTATKAIGFKVRCAGPTALDLDTLAAIIPLVVQHRLPFKATQGLHHPLVEPALGDPHGFLGLVAALRFRTVLGDRFPHEALRDCLAAARPTDFSFADGLGWRGHHITAEGLDAAKAAVPFTIGSCDLAEPDAGLVRSFKAADVRH